MSRLTLVLPCLALAGCSLLVSLDKLTGDADADANRPGTQRPADETNRVVVRNQSSVVLRDYPLQFGRPFLPGAIQALPLVFVEGSPIPTQADVKQRWPDGSVRFAIVSVMIDSLAPSAALTLEFGQRVDDSKGVALSAAEMLEPAFDFEAQMTLTSGTESVTASARKMLEEGKFEPWLSGPIATSVILADHGSSRAYDLGFDSYRSIRPIFEATFWPKTHQVRVRFIGENSNTTTLQDVSYDLVLGTGSATPKAFYARANVPHYFGTRWTKLAWMPAEAAPPADVAIDYGLAYLAKTQFVPNFDTSASVPSSYVTNLASSWASAKHDLYELGLWSPYMSDAPYPAATDLWLRTGDPRARGVALAQAELAGAWPLHWREGGENTKFDRKGSVNGLGLPMSLNAHPELWFPDNLGNYAGKLSTPRIAEEAAWRAVGTLRSDPFSPQYMLTGEHYYLEEMQFWAAAQALSYNTGEYGRGAAGYGGITDDLARSAVVFRNRSNAAFFSPDGSPQKTYFNELVEDAIAFWEGQRNITASTLTAHPEWQFGRGKLAFDTSPLRFFTLGEPVRSSSWNGLDVTTTSQATSLEASYYLLTQLGFARERGFAAGPLFEWFAPVLTGQFGDPGYEPVLLAAPSTPVMDQNGTFFPTWAAVSQAVPGATRDSIAASWDSGLRVSALYATAAAAMTHAQPGGDAAWKWLDAKLRPTRQLVFNEAWYSWDLLPRPAGTLPLPAPTP